MNWFWILQTITLVVIGIIGYFLKDSKKTIDDKIENSERRINKLEQELTDLKTDLPFIYVTREDFIRAMANVETKLDKIYDQLMKGSVSTYGPRKSP